MFFDPQAFFRRSMEVITGPSAAPEDQPHTEIPNLLNLPVELKLPIFREALRDALGLEPGSYVSRYLYKLVDSDEGLVLESTRPNGKKTPARSSPKPPHPLALLQTCRTIYNDASVALSDLTVFHLWLHDATFPRYTEQFMLNLWPLGTGSSTKVYSKFARNPKPPTLMERWLNKNQLPEFDLASIRRLSIQAHYVTENRAAALVGLFEDLDWGAHLQSCNISLDMDPSLDVFVLKKLSAVPSARSRSTLFINFQMKLPEEYSRRSNEDLTAKVRLGLFGSVDEEKLRDLKRSLEASFIVRCWIFVERRGRRYVKLVGN